MTTRRPESQIRIPQRPHSRFPHLLARTSDRVAPDKTISTEIASGQQLDNSSSAGQSGDTRLRECNDGEAGGDAAGGVAAGGVAAGGVAAGASEADENPGENEVEGTPEANPFEDDPEEDGYCEDRDTSYEFIYPDGSGQFRYHSTAPKPGDGAGSRIQACIRMKVFDDDTGRNWHWSPIPSHLEAPTSLTQQQYHDILLDIERMEASRANARQERLPPSQDNINSGLPEESDLSHSSDDYARTQAHRLRLRLHNSKSGKPSSDTEMEDLEEEQDLLSENGSGPHSKPPTKGKRSGSRSKSSRRRQSGTTAKTKQATIPITDFLEHGTSEEDGEEDGEGESEEEGEGEGGEGRSRRKGKCTREELKAYRELADEITSAVQRVAEKYGRDPGAVMLKACSVVKAGRAPNSANMFRKWYSKAYPKDENRMFLHSVLLFYSHLAVRGIRESG